MLHPSVVSLVLTASLLSPAAERPLAVSLAAGAQAADTRLQVRPTAQTEPTEPAAKPADQGMSRGKKIAIAVGIVAGAVLLWAALDDDDSGGGGGGY
jgi:hypothetical protein